MADDALLRKLLVRPDRRLLVLAAPPGLAGLAGDPSPADAPGRRRPGRAPPAGLAGLAGDPPEGGPPYEVVLLFVGTQADVARRAPDALAALAPDGVLWLAYPKRTSKVATDLT